MRLPYLFYTDDHQCVISHLKIKIGGRTSTWSFQVSNNLKREVAVFGNKNAKLLHQKYFQL